MSSLQNQETVSEVAANAIFQTNLQNSIQSNQLKLAQASADAQKAAKSNGRVFLVTEILKDLRTERLQSQEDMANACSDGKFRVSIASIKRAETGRAVVFRVARELARYFGVPVQKLLRPDSSGLVQLAESVKSSPGEHSAH